MTDTTIRATYSNANDRKIVMLSMDTQGMQATGFLYDIQAARYLLIQLGWCIKEWERAEASDKESLTVHTDNDGEPLPAPHCTAPWEAK